MLPGIHLLLVALALVQGEAPVEGQPSLAPVEVIGPASEGRRRGPAPFTVRGRVDLPPAAVTGSVIARVTTVTGVEEFTLEGHTGGIDFTLRLAAAPLALEIETLSGSVARSLAAELAPPPDGARLASLAARLAAPDMTGRLTGSEGQQHAAEAMVQALHEAEVRPTRLPGQEGDGHLHTFSIVVREPGAETSLEVLDRSGAAIAVPIAPFIFSPPTGEGGSALLPARFAGYGLARPGADDYLDADLAGDLAVVRTGVPPLLAHQEAAPLLREKIAAAQAHKAGALLILDETLSLPAPGAASAPAGGGIPPVSPLAAWLSQAAPQAAVVSSHERLRADLAQAAQFARVTMPVREAPSIPVLAGGIEAVEALLAARSLDAAMADLRDRHPPGTAPLPLIARLRVAFLWRTISGRNVAGVIRPADGADEKERAVALVTCTDGRGLDAEGRPTSGQELTAWSSAAVIEAAHGGAARQGWLARPLVIGLLDGGEWGGLGARNLATLLAQEKSQPPLQTLIVVEAHLPVAGEAAGGAPALVARGADHLVARAVDLAAALGLEIAVGRGGETNASSEALGERAVARLFLRFHIAPEDQDSLLGAARLIAALAVSEAATP
jgi:hypothetical protein